MGRFVVVDIAGGADLSFNCILWWVLEFDGCRDGFFVEGCSVRYVNRINIIVVGSTSFILIMESGKMVLFMIWSMSVLA